MPPITQLGKYQIRRELSKGAMGIVYEGFDPGIERIVAIKTILPSQLKGGEVNAVLARFKREAQAAGRLNHPGIVAVYDYGEVVAETDHTMVAGAQPPLGGGQRVAFIAMEYVKGRELKDYFDADERFALKEVERLMVEMLDALEHAHGKGVIHRDMKPANLIVLADGRIKIADFGIARLETSELTQAGTILGTPSYMSPEQFMGQTVDGRSDLFSCGVILYQFLTGEKPFTGNATTIMYKVLREEPLAPSTLNLTLPAAWDAVVKKAIAKVPTDRFQSAREFADAIKAAAARRGDDPTFVGAYSASPQANDTATRVARPPPLPAPVAQPAIQPGVTPIVFSKMAPPVVPAPSVADIRLPAARPVSNGARVGGIAGVLLVGAAAAFWFTGKDRANAPITAQAPPVAVVAAASGTVTGTAAPASPAVVAALTAAPAPAPAATETIQEPGTLIISALGLVDPKDPKHGQCPSTDAGEDDRRRRQDCVANETFDIEPIKPFQEPAIDSTTHRQESVREGKEIKQ